MREDEPDIRWTTVPYNKKERILNQINEELKAQGIAEVHERAVWWRMSRVLKNLKFTEGTYNSCTFK